MQQTDTQEVVVDAKQASDIMRNVLAPQTVPARQNAPQPPAEQKQAEPAPVAESKPVEKAEAPKEAPKEQPQEVAKATISDANVSMENDPYAKVVEQIAGGSTPTIQWGDDAKNLFKQTFGAEDPLAFKTEVETKLTKLDLVQKEAEELKPLKQAFESLPPALHAAFQKALAGDVIGAQQYLKEMPSVALENKDAKELTDKQLIDTYFPGKMTPEKWNMLNDPEVDAEVKEALKERVNVLRDTAEMRHEAKRKEAIEQATRYQAEAEARAKNWQDSVASTITNAKQSPLGAFVDHEFTNDIQTGKYLTKFVQPDGVTPTPEAATLLLKGIHFDKAVKAAEERGFARGQQKQLQEDTARMPNANRPVVRDSGDAPMEKSAQDLIRSLTYQALSSNR